MSECTDGVPSHSARSGPALSERCYTHFNWALTESLLGAGSLKGQWHTVYGVPGTPSLVFLNS